MTANTFDPIPINQTAQSFSKQTPDERRAHYRSFAFWFPSDLVVFKADNQPGDDSRADLPLSEIVVFSLLANHSLTVERKVFGYAKPLRCVTHSRQPLCAVAWDRGNGVLPYITDGRQRGGDSEQRGTENPGAIEAINRRVKMLCDLAIEIRGKAPADAIPVPRELSIKVRNDAIARYKRGEVGWGWAEPITMPLYVGGVIGDAKPLATNPGCVYPGLIEWDSPLNTATHIESIPYVAWVAWEPEDRDPATFQTQLASIALKAAQVATPPTAKAKQYRSLCGDRTPQRLENETDETYEKRATCHSYGQGLPVPFVARHDGVDKNWVYFLLSILDLESEVQEALDANARGEEGLSLNQVRNGGFFISTTGGAGNERIAKSRPEQMKLLDELRGKRGIKLRGESEAEESDGSRKRTGGTESGSGDGMSDPRRKREVSDENSAGSQHSADEPRAKVGPDSPAMAGESQKAARLDGSLFLAVRDRISADIEALIPDANGKLLDNSERTIEQVMEYRLHDALYQFAALFAGDPTAFEQSEAEPAMVNKFRRQAKDAIDEVLRAKSLTIRPNVGPVGTGATVLAKADRHSVELVVTPRKGGEVAASTGIMIPVSTDANQSAKALETPKSAKVAKPKKERRKGPLKPKKVPLEKAPKVTKQVKEPKPAKVKAEKAPKPAEMPKSAKTPKFPKSTPTPAA